MLPLLLLLLTTQVPAVPGEGTLVSSCKQGMLSACEALRQLSPEKADALQKAALRLQALKVAEDEAKKDASESSSVEAAGEPPNCDGQIHHVISKAVFTQLEKHKNLRGRYEYRDKRFEARAKDKESHCGYQEWHRKLDREIVEWLVRYDEATPEEFENYLRERYKRPDLLERFPNGF